MRLLLIILIIFLLFSYPGWPYLRERPWRAYPSGGIGFIILIVVILLLLGY